MDENSWNTKLICLDLWQLWWLLNYYRTLNLLCISRFSTNYRCMIKLLAIAPMLCWDLHQTGENITAYQFIGALALTWIIKSHRQYSGNFRCWPIAWSFDLKTDKRQSEATSHNWHHYWESHWLIAMDSFGRDKSRTENIWGTVKRVLRWWGLFPNFRGLA
jgi:hypothetical protein